MAELIGRRTETARVEAFLADCRCRRAALVIEGEPGIGKSALFESTIASASGLTVLRVQCVEAESALVYTGLADLLGAWVPAALPALASPRRRALEVALLRADVGAETLEPAAVGWATLDVLYQVAAGGPVLIAIDDVQWLDAASGQALTFALRRLDKAVASVLATRRQVGGPLPLGLDCALPETCRDRLVLGPLDRAEVRSLLEGRFGGQFPSRWLPRILAASAGNPMYAVELAAAQLTAGSSVEDPLAVPPRLEELLAARLGRLSSQATEPLAAVACLAAPTVAMVVNALGTQARAGLDRALDERVLRVSEGRLWFAHPLLGMVAVKRLAPSVRRALHARLAVCATDDEERGRHLVLSADGPDSATAAAAERAADLARARGAPQAAAEAAEAAVRLTPPECVPDLVRRRVAAGYHWVSSGDVARGRAHMAAALEAVAPGPARAEMSWRLAMLTHLDGDLPEAVRLLETARAAAGDNPMPLADVNRRLAGLYAWQGRIGEALPCWTAALESARATGDHRGELETLATYSAAAILTNTVALADLAGRIQQLIELTGPHLPQEDPEAALAMIDFVVGDAGAAAARLERLGRRAVEHGDEMAPLAIPRYLAEAHLALGDWPRARQLAQRAALAAHQASVARAFGFDLYPVALVEAHLGNVGPARTAALALIELAERRGLPLFLLQGRVILGFLALSCGDARAAHAEFDRVLRQGRQQGIREWGLLPLVYCDLDALVELGELDQAEAFAAEIWSHGQEFDRPMELAVAARARGLVLSARGDLAGARAELDRSMAEQDRLGWPFERARTLLALGAVLRRGKQKRLARETLHRALTVFDELGARLWSAKATAELGRVGGRPMSTGSLTATERRVAQLAADGYTNREVADQLFLSPKTVAAHLTSVYAKLGVRSRTELSRQFREMTS